MRGGATCQLPNLTALLSVVPIVFICLFFIFAAVPDAHAASGYLADEIGNTEIAVDVDETFYVVLWLVDVTELAGYDCAITISGPATATGTAAHGDWFADGHTVTQGGGPTATYTSAMLSNPTYVSGSGDLVVFTLHADDDGVVAINIDEDIFCLGNDDAEEITITVPSTLYVTVGTGEGDGMGQGENPPPPAEEEYSQDDEPDSPLDSGSTWYVDASATGDEDGSADNPFNTIQEGINWASSGDTVLVMPGTYTGTDNLNLEILPRTTPPDPPKVLTIRAYSTDPEERSTIDCGSASYNVAFKFVAGDSPDTIIEGFRIINANVVDRGAIDCDGAAPVIRNNLITQNKTTGIRCFGCPSEVVIEGNTISDNAFDGSRFIAGIHIRDCTFLITGNTISNNDAQNASGGGIFCEKNAWDGPLSGCIASNSIDRNSLSNCYTGGAIWIDFATDNVTLADNSISENTVDADFGSGGIYYIAYYETPGDIVIHNNAITCNVTTRAGINGGGGVIIRDCWSPVVIDGNVIMGNSNVYIGGGINLTVAYYAFLTNNAVIGNVTNPDDWGVAWGGGVAVYSPYQVPRLENNLIVGNSCIASGDGEAFGGGIMVFDASESEIINNTIAGNRAVSASAQSACGGAGIAVKKGCTVTAANCIMWDNEVVIGSSAAKEQIRLIDAGWDAPSSLTIDYSDVEGGELGVAVEDNCTLNWGNNNVDDDPEFASAWAWDDNGTSSDPTDDVWTLANFSGEVARKSHRLKSPSGRWDDTAGACGGWVYADSETSPCIDAGDLSSEYFNESFFNGGRVNMGFDGNTIRSTRSLPPASSDFIVSDQTTGSRVFTNSTGVDIAITPPSGMTIVGYLVTETPEPPSSGWLQEVTTYTFTSDQGEVVLYAWMIDNNNLIIGGTSTIFYSTASPQVSYISASDNGDNTATVSWDTDIASEGKLLYGKLIMAGTTPNSTALEGALLTIRHSRTFPTNIPADTNYKIVIVNNESNWAPIYWPNPWPIDGDANMDCRVNILDLIFIRNKLNLDPDVGDNWKADVTKDGRINILDLIHVRNKLNTQCPES